MTQLWCNFTKYTNGFPTSVYRIESKKLQEHTWDSATSRDY